MARSQGLGIRQRNLYANKINTVYSCAQHKLTHGSNNKMSKTKANYRIWGVGLHRLLYIDDP